jgi:glycosyl transferase, family 25
MANSNLTINSASFNKIINKYKDNICIFKSIKTFDEIDVIDNDYNIELFDNYLSTFSINVGTNNLIIVGNYSLYDENLFNNLFDETEQFYKKFKSINFIYPYIDSNNNMLLTNNIIEKCNTNNIVIYLMTYDTSLCLYFNMMFQSLNTIYCPLEKEYFESSDKEITETTSSSFWKTMHYIMLTDNDAQNCQFIQRSSKPMIQYNVISKCTKNFDIFPSYIITLERDAERMKNVFHNLIPNLANWAIFSAIDGLKEKGQLELFISSHQHLKLENGYNNRVNRGQLGCWFSHISIWEKIITEKIPVALILEDDAKINTTFYKNLMKMYNELPENWKMLYLYIFPEHYRNDNDIMLEDKSLICKGYKTYCTTSYMLSYEGAVELLKLSVCLFTHIDNQIGSLIHNNYLKDVYMAKVPIVKNVGQTRSLPDAKLPSNIWISEKWQSELAI